MLNYKLMNLFDVREYLLEMRCSFKQEAFFVSTQKNFNLLLRKYQAVLNKNLITFNMIICFQKGLTTQSFMWRFNNDEKSFLRKIKAAEIIILPGINSFINNICIETLLYI
jgi:hypothetical protein